MYRDTPTTTFYPSNQDNTNTVQPSGHSNYQLPVSAMLKLTQVDLATNLFKFWEFCFYQNYLHHSLNSPNYKNDNYFGNISSFKIVHNCIFGRGQFIMKNPENADLIIVEMCPVYFL